MKFPQQGNNYNDNNKRGHRNTGCSNHAAMETNKKAMHIMHFGHLHMDIWISATKQDTAT